MMEVARVLRLDLLIKLSLAVLLGGIIGFERELAGKPAGLRTNILICLGAALLMDISTRIGLVDGHRIGDPARIAAQVVSGVGFIGAGTIMQGAGRRHRADLGGDHLGRRGDRAHGRRRATTSKGSAPACWSPSCCRRWAGSRSTSGGCGAV